MRSFTPDPDLSFGQDSKSQLFERYDRLNAAFELAEKRLADKHIPQPIAILYDSHPLNTKKDLGKEHYLVGIQKVKGRWRICHGIYDDTEVVPGQSVPPVEWTPIVESAAQLRVEVAKRLGMLETALIESHIDFMREVDEAISLVERFGTQTKLPTIMK